MSAFWDASALAHVCVPGQITKATRDLVRTDSIVVWWSTRLEVRSLLNRLRREVVISSASLRASWHRGSGLLLGSLMILPADAVKESGLAQPGPLPPKGLSDALQLAAALIWCKQKPARPLVCLQ